MPVARIQVRLNSKSTNLIEMIAIQMRIYSEQPPRNHAHRLAEIAWKGDTDLVWEYSLIIQEALHPVHHRVDILGR